MKNSRQQNIRGAVKEIKEALNLLEEGIKTSPDQEERWACEDILQNVGILCVMGEEKCLPKNWQGSLTGGKVAFYGGLEILKSLRKMPGEIGKVMGDTTMFPARATWEDFPEWFARLLDNGTIQDVFTPDEDEVISLSWLAWAGYVAFSRAEKNFLPGEMTKLSRALEEAVTNLDTTFADPVVSVWFKPYLQKRANEYLPFLTTRPPSFFVF